MTELNDILKLTSFETMKMPEGFTPFGWVYVLANESMPGVYKIGMTSSTPEKRAKEISSSTGVPTPFIVISEYRSFSPYEHEKDIHNMLARYRVSQGREFFKIDLQTIEDACEKVIPFGSVTQVEDLTEYFNLILLERPDRNDPWPVLEAMGINAYGDKDSAVKILAYLGAMVVKHVTEYGGSLVVKDSLISLLGAEDVPV
ncbi:T5orf172 domain [Serratia quinivorans]|uniref:GIY-YIG nuclease family protein n=1 Tax=Serratia quinivorans TaxID=137545 RepID=UPI002179E528|nr:GIY-YIG nuclease family protein [Serratia quinivorans]CAI1819624.1 T5orf172 domain [Serratia quinivorans]